MVFPSIYPSKANRIRTLKKHKSRFFFFPFRTIYFLGGGFLQFSIKEYVKNRVVSLTYLSTRL
jgi:hypothetical protein